MSSTPTIFSAALVASGKLAVQRFRWNQLRRNLKSKNMFQNQNQTSSSASASQVQINNPFLPHFSLKSGRWVKPEFSLRQQAQLAKRARKADLLHLLPSGPKSSLLHLTPAPSSDHGPSIEWLPDKALNPPKSIASSSSLYATKKRLFKGHKWQRSLESRTSILAAREKGINRRNHHWKLNRMRRLRSPIAATKPSSRTKLPF